MRERCNSPAEFHVPRSSRRPSLPLHGDPSASLCAPLASPRHQDRPRSQPETPARPPRSSACHRLKTQPSPLPLGLSSTTACAAAPRGTKPFFVRPPCTLPSFLPLRTDNSLKWHCVPTLEVP